MLLVAGERGQVVVERARERVGVLAVAACLCDQGFDGEAGSTVTGFVCQRAQAGHGRLAPEVAFLAGVDVAAAPGSGRVADGRARGQFEVEPGGGHQAP